MQANQTKAIPTSLKAIYSIEIGFSMFTFYQTLKFTYIRETYSPFPGKVNEIFYKGNFEQLDNIKKFNDYSKTFKSIEFLTN